MEVRVKEGEVFNAIAINGIICRNCRVIVPMEEFAQHQQKHLLWKYKATQFKNNMKIPKKQDLRICDDEEDNENNYDDLSFKISEMPKHDENRKNPIEPKCSPKNNLIPYDNFKEIEGYPYEVKGNNQPIDEMLTEISQVTAEDREVFEEIQYTKRVKHPRVRRTLKTKKGYNYYGTDKENENKLSDNVQIQKKLKNRDNEEVKICEKEEEFYNVEKLLLEFEPLTIDVNSKAKPPIQKKINVCQIPLTLTPLSSNSCYHNLMCPNCKGFFCKVCGSDIPPKFRPIPGQQISQQCKQFWQKRKKGFNCQNCQQ